MRVLTSGLGWTGGEFGSIQTAFEQALESSEHDVLLVAYAMSTAAGSVFDYVERCLARGCSVRMIVNRFQEQHASVQQRLQGLLDRYRRLRIYDFVDPSGADLHAKFLVVDRRTAIVGSANVSWRGLVSNHELGLWVDDQPLVDSILSAAEKMLSSPMVTELS